MERRLLEKHLENFPKIKKMSGGKSLYISQEYRFKKKILNQSQKKIRLEKGLFFWVTLIQAVVSKTLRLF